MRALSVRVLEALAQSVSRTVGGAKLYREQARGIIYYFYKMRTYFVYIIQCSDNSYYVGVTNNIERRLFEHQSGLHTESYTYNRRPLKLMFVQPFNDINQAIAFEKQIKKWSRSKKEALINDNWEKLPELSKKKNFNNE